MNAEKYKEIPLESWREGMNKLSQETSPYLLQHADNPVDWHPWGEDALALAKSQNKPILLSIGYSACHWCHVMAHESFEDESTATLMNELFVNIKVDREERPDLDKIYQSAHHMLTRRSGGWPLTMFLMPDDHMPFFGGTYFPDEPRHGMISFKDLLQRVRDSFDQRKGDIQRQNDSLAEALNSVYSPDMNEAVLSSAPLDQARMGLQQQFDIQDGGFGIAPKFPHTPNLERLMRHGFGKTEQDEKAITIASYTLEKMALGGINDQLGGGFCRYSVDDYWMIPHFEKMLYDNGSLLAEYAQASAAIDHPLFTRVSHETAQWVMREMQENAAQPNNGCIIELPVSKNETASSLKKGGGGYYSSFDADSLDDNGHSHEGLFYVWKPEEVRELLSTEEYPVFARRFGLDQHSNFEGAWHLHVYINMQQLAEEFEQSEKTLTALIDSARSKLMVVRNQRIWPGRDDKILTSWNALMIRGMAMAARYLNTATYEESATQALDFIQKTLWQNNQLLATYKANSVDGIQQGKAHLNAYLDDYAFLLDAVLELLQVRWRSEDLTFATQLADALLEHFEDKQNGGFWFTSHNHEQLIQRPKTYTDDAIPNGNGIAAFALQRLGYLLGETRYLDAAERTLKNAATGFNQAPTAHCTLLKALEEYLQPPQTVIIRGEPAELELLKKEMGKRYTPRRQSYFIPVGEQNLPAGLKDKKPVDTPVAYLCEGMTCLSPIKENLLVTLLRDEEIIN